MFFVIDIARASLIEQIKHELRQEVDEALVKPMLGLDLTATKTQSTENLPVCSTSLVVHASFRVRIVRVTSNPISLKNSHHNHRPLQHTHTTITTSRRSPENAKSSKDFFYTY